MASNSKKCLIAICVICFVVLATGCDFTSRITFFNRTDGTMTQYPVIVNDTVDPPTARREARPGENLAPTESVAIAINGFNPVFYVPGIDDESKANGIYIGLNLFDADPIQVQYKVFHYRVPPGATAGDPDLQPILLQNEIVEVEDVNVSIAVRSGEPSPDGWNVTIRERP